MEEGRCGKSPAGTYDSVPVSEDAWWQWSAHPTVEVASRLIITDGRGISSGASDHPVSTAGFRGVEQAEG